MINAKKIVKDYSCPYCSEFNKERFRLKRKYGDELCEECKEDFGHSLVTEL